MWNNLSYERRTYIIIAFMTMILFVGYHTSLKKTFESFIKMRSYAEGSTNISIDELAGLKNRLSFLDSSYHIISKTDFDDALFSEVNSLTKKHNVRLIELSRNKIGSSSIEVIELQGGFNGLLQSIFNFEKNFQVGKVVSSHFKKVNDRVSKQSHLHLTIYVQRIKKNED